MSQNTNSMKRPKKAPLSSVLAQFTISYLLLIVIPVIMGIANYFTSISEATKQTLYSNALILKQAATTMENSLKAIQEHADAISGYYVEQVAGSYDVKSLDIRVVQKAVRELPRLTSSNPYVKAYYLYSSRNRTLLAPNQFFYDVSPYFAYIWNGVGMDFEEWSGKVIEPAPSQPKLSAFQGEEGKGDYLLYQTPYFSHNGSILGKFLYELDEKQVQKTLNPAFQLGADFMYIADRDGNFLVTLSKENVSPQRIALETESGSMEANLHGERMIVSYCALPDYGLDFVIAIPQKVLRATCQSNLSITLLGTIVLVLGGVALVFGSFLYNRRPLATMAKSLEVRPYKGKRAGQNGLWQLSRSMFALMQSIRTMEEKLGEQQRHLRDALFMQLVTGELLNEGDLEGNLLEYGVELPLSGRFRGAYLELRADQTQASPDKPPVSDWLMEILGSVSPSLTPLCRVDSSHFALLYAEEEDAAECRFEGFFKELYSLIKENSGVEAVFFVGCCTQKLGHVSRSFSDARKLMRRPDISAQRILFFQEDGPGNQESFLYTQTQEDALLEYCELGEYEPLEALIDSIYRNNFKERRLSAYMSDLLLFRLAGTLYGSKWGKEIEPQKLDVETLSTQSFFRKLKELYRTICEQSVCAHKEEQSKTEEAIVGYLNERFCDREMSLSALSYQFGMTEIYLSGLIKRLVGENFLSYIEKLRFQKANELLSDERMAISEIGFQVGYENAASFRRAYKRVMGYAPSEYVKHHRIHKNP